MEEKQKSNNGIYIFIIVLLLCVIAGMWYYYNILKKPVNTKNTNTTLSPSAHDDSITENTTTPINTNTSNINYIDITKELPDKEVFYLIDYNENSDGTVTLYGAIYERVDAFSAELKSDTYKKITVSNDVKYKDYYSERATAGTMMENIRHIKSDNFDNYDLPDKIGAWDGLKLDFTFENNKCVLVEEIAFAI